MVSDWPIRIVVFGKAAPAGSKTAFVIRDSAGNPTNRASVVDANPRVKPWQAVVVDAARDQYKGEPLACAVDVEMIFIVPWRKGDYGSGRNAEVLRDAAPLQPTTAPDVLKLARGVEDALSGWVYKDDAQIVNEAIQKRYGERAMVEIRVRPTALTCVRDLIMMGQERPTRPSELMPFEQLTLAVA